MRSRAGRYGRSRIALELKARGFSRETAEAALEELSAEKEENALTRALERLWKSHAGLDRAARRRRVWNALLARGFSAGRVSAIMKGFDAID